MTDQPIRTDESGCFNYDVYCPNQTGGRCRSKEGCPLIVTSTTRRELLATADDLQQSTLKVARVPASR